MPPNMKLMDVVVDAAMDAAMDNYYITSHVQSACIGQDDAALDAAKVSYNIKKGFHIMDPDQHILIHIFIMNILNSDSYSFSMWLDFMYLTKNYEARDLMMAL